MFVGEAPGRRGAARTGIPFLGDESGRRFETLLAAAGLTRDQVYITNAVRCLPLDAAGNNRRPSRAEIATCAAAWLESDIAAVEPAVVVALGAVALEALAAIEPHNLALARDVARPTPWHTRTLIALYHPGARSAIHRPWDLQVEDWKSSLAVVAGSPIPSATGAG